MVNNTESIRSLQDTTTRHEQTLASLETHVANQEKWNTTTQITLREIARQLQNIAAQLGSSATTSADDKITADSTLHRGKTKVRSDSDDTFSFPSKLVQVELPIFIGDDPEGWISSAHDFFEFYGTDDHHRVTMASFRMTSTTKKWFWWMQ
ncbi:hypothetical protein HRI_003357700 [Hibiscus trionum]|uniref:Uncharacterized protein n=1 Tax=Hibiscus trionum TaxID=183268 RepID=A0A9W7IHM4_HIBTR|nr:hypothetical protein HRI_003357700 [Hibiscus trionum]